MVFWSMNFLFASKLDNSWAFSCDSIESSFKYSALISLATCLITIDSRSELLVAIFRPFWSRAISPFSSNLGFIPRYIIVTYSVFTSSSSTGPDLRSNALTSLIVPSLWSTIMNGILCACILSANSAILSTGIATSHFISPPSFKWFINNSASFVVFEDSIAANKSSVLSTISIPVLAPRAIIPVSCTPCPIMVPP